MSDLGARVTAVKHASFASRVRTHQINLQTDEPTQQVQVVNNIYPKRRVVSLSRSVFIILAIICSNMLISFTCLLFICRVPLSLFCRCPRLPDAPKDGDVCILSEHVSMGWNRHRYGGYVCRIMFQYAY
jgi:hypothetical protein